MHSPRATFYTQISWAKTHPLSRIAHSLPVFSSKCQCIATGGAAGRSARIVYPLFVTQKLYYSPPWTFHSEIFPSLPAYHYSKRNSVTNDINLGQGCGVLVFCGTPTPTQGLIVWHNDCVLKDDLGEIFNSSNKKWPRVGPGHPSFPPCPFTSSSFPLFTFPFLSLALLIFFFCPSLPFLPE